MLLIWEGLDSENLQNKRQRLVKKNIHYDFKSV